MWQKLIKKLKALKQEFIEGYNKGYDETAEKLTKEKK